jgi:hypothetical protein
MHTNESRIPYKCIVVSFKLREPWKRHNFSINWHNNTRIRHWRIMNDIPFDWRGLKISLHWIYPVFGTRVASPRG